MSGKSKASDRTDQPFYENYPTLDFRDTRRFTRQDGFQNRHKGL